jgi:hypothetical protein
LALPPSKGKLPEIAPSSLHRQFMLTEKGQRRLLLTSPATKTYGIHDTQRSSSAQNAYQFSKTWYCEDWNCLAILIFIDEELALKRRKFACIVTEILEQKINFTTPEAVLQSQTSANHGFTHCTCGTHADALL